MALCTGWPVRRSHTTAVSRWFVMPIAAMSLARRPAAAIASRATSRCVDQISAGSCSTHAVRGKIWRNSRCAAALARPLSSKTMARELVVPWSSASMCGTRPPFRRGSRHPRATAQSTSARPAAAPGGMGGGGEGGARSTLLADGADEVLLVHPAPAADTGLARDVAEFRDGAVFKRPPRVAGPQGGLVRRAALLAPVLVHGPAGDLLGPVLGDAALPAALLDVLVLAAVLVGP